MSANQTSPSRPARNRVSRRAIALAVTVGLTAGMITVAQSADAVVSPSQPVGSCENSAVFPGVTSCAGIFLPSDGSGGTYDTINPATGAVVSSSGGRWIGMYQVGTAAGVASGWCITDRAGHPIGIANPASWNPTDWAAFAASQLLLMQNSDGTWVWTPSTNPDQNLRAAAGWALGHIAAQDGSTANAGIPTVSESTLLQTFTGPAAVIGTTASEALTFVRDHPGVWKINSSASSTVANQVDATASIVDGNGNVVPILIDLDASTGQTARSTNGTVSLSVSSTSTVTFSATSAQWDPTSGPQILLNTNASQQDLMGLTVPVQVSATASATPISGQVVVKKLVGGVAQGGGYTFEISDAASGTVYGVRTTSALGVTAPVIVPSPSTVSIRETASGSAAVLVNPNPITVTIDASGTATPSVAGVVSFSDVLAATGSTKADAAAVTVVDPTLPITVGDTLTITGTPGDTVNWSIQPYFGDKNPAVCTAGNSAGAAQTGTATIGADGTASAHVTWTVVPGTATDIHFGENVSQPAWNNPGTPTCAGPNETTAIFSPVVGTQAQAPRMVLTTTAPILVHDVVNGTGLNPGGAGIKASITAHVTTGDATPSCADATIGTAQIVDLIGDATGKASAASAPVLWTPTSTGAFIVHFGESFSADGGATWTAEKCGNAGESLDLSVPSVITQAQGPATGLVLTDLNPVTVRDTVTATGLHVGATMQVRIQAHVTTGTKAPSCSDPTVGAAQTITLTGTPGFVATGTTPGVTWTPADHGRFTVHFGESKSDDGITWTPETCGAPGESLKFSVPDVSTQGQGPASGNVLPGIVPVSIHDVVRATGLQPGAAITVKVQAHDTYGTAVQCTNGNVGEARTVTLIGGADGTAVASTEAVTWTPIGFGNFTVHFGESFSTDGGTTFTPERCGQPGETLKLDVPQLMTTAVQPDQAAINQLKAGMPFTITDTVAGRSAAPGSKLAVTIIPLIVGANGPSCEDARIDGAWAQTIVVTADANGSFSGSASFTVPVPKTNVPMHFAEQVSTLDGTLVGTPNCGSNPDEFFTLFRAQRSPASL